MLLTLGYAMLALVAIFVCANATSLYLAQKRLDALADAAALAGADGFTISTVGRRASRRPARRRRASLRRARSWMPWATVPTLVSAGTPDGLSARVTVATVWHAPIVSLFVPDGVALVRHGDEPHGAALTTVGPSGASSAAFRPRAFSVVRCRNRPISRWMRDA